MQQSLFGPLGQAAPRRVHGELQVLGHRLHDPLEVLGRPRAAPPRRDRALRQRQVLVGHAELRVDLELGAEPHTRRAGTEGRVERKRPRLDLVDRERVVVGAGHPLGEPPRPLRVAFRSIDKIHEEYAAREQQGGLDRVGEAAFGARVVALGHQPVDDDLDRVLDLLLQLGRLGQRDDLAVNPRSGEPLGLQLGEEIDELALAPLNHRREDLEARPLGQLHEPVDDLLRALAGDRLLAHRAVGPTDAGEEQPQVVVDLGDRADRRARVAVGGLLVDRDGR
jgi:hypothetical protein